MSETTELPEDDDAAAELLADAWLAGAETDPRLLKLARRAVGLLKAPAEMTIDELACDHGTDRFVLSRVAQRALQKLRFTPEIRSLKSED